MGVIYCHAGPLISDNTTKDDTAFPSDHQLPIGPKRGVGPQKPLPFAWWDLDSPSLMQENQSHSEFQPGHIWHLGFLLPALL